MCDSPFYVRHELTGENMPFPCGRCPVCKRRRVSQWVFRMMKEDERQKFGHFVTLTYDTKHVPITDHGFMTLCKRDFQLYMKRLRKLCKGDKLKYYCVGEYGTKRMRPHFHAIIFGVSDIDRFSDAWQLGNVYVGKVSGDSVAYTCKYMDKERKIPLHSRDDRIKEFSLMSHGLGENYLTDAMVAYHKSDLSRNYVTTKTGYRVALPKYYRDKIFSDDEKFRQRKLIERDKLDKRNIKILKIEALYGSKDIDAWEESEKEGRYKHYYKRQKEREL